MRVESRGSMLIIALGVLTLISILAVTFVTLMHYEKSAATNYVDGVKAKFAAMSGIQRIAADSKRLAQESAFDPQSAQLRNFIFGVAPNRKEIYVGARVEEIDPRAPGNVQAYFHHRLGATYEGGDDECRVNFSDLPLRELRPIGRGGGVRSIEEAVEPMLGTPEIGCSRGGAEDRNVEIDLGAVGVDDYSARLLGKGERQRGLAAGGRPRN